MDNRTELLKELAVGLADRFTAFHSLDEIQDQMISWDFGGGVPLGEDACRIVAHHIFMHFRPAAQEEVETIFAHGRPAEEEAE